MSLALRGLALRHLEHRIFHRIRPFSIRWKSNHSAIDRDALQRKPPLAFAFDIDGVLIRGKQALPQAQRALKILNGQNDLGIKIPFILITNGGGMSESIRCERLSELLDLEISVNQFMQAHTIYKTIVGHYADKPILVLGGKAGAVPQVAEEYGFRKAISPLEIKQWNPRLVLPSGEDPGMDNYAVSVWPFYDLTDEELDFVKLRPHFDPLTRFAGIFVFHDPRNWALDTQISLDIINNDGYVLPTRMEPKSGQKFENSKGNSDFVKLFFCNPDLLWGSDYPTPRIGQGAFRTAFQSVHHSLTGRFYPYEQYGKPTKATFDFAERLLKQRFRELLGKSEDDDVAKDVLNHIPNVYMVGDNPESDIAGANAKGWQSILVKTGVYFLARGPPTHQPTHMADDVEQAVLWAMNREFSRVLQ